MYTALESQLNIVICTFNAAIHLRACLLSIAAQQDDEMRVWIFDGASTDSTLHIIEEFRDLVHYFDSVPDSGVYDAMNRAISTVRDGWILFLGADDRLMPNSISNLRHLWPQLPLDTAVVYGDVYRPNANIIYDGRFSKWKLVRRNMCQQGLLYNVNVVKKFSLNIQFPINADHILNLDLMLSGLKFSYLPVCLAYYEDIAAGISRDRGDLNFVASRRRLIRDYGDWPLFLFSCAIDARQEVLRKVRQLFFRR